MLFTEDASKNYENSSQSLHLKLFHKGPSSSQGCTHTHNHAIHYSKRRVIKANSWVPQTFITPKCMQRLLLQFNKKGYHIISTQEGFWKIQQEHSSTLVRIYGVSILWHNEQEGSFSQEATFFPLTINIFHILQLWSMVAATLAESLKYSKLIMKIYSVSISILCCLQKFRINCISVSARYNYPWHYLQQF